MAAPSRRWLLALVILCVAAFALCFQHVKESLPYPSLNDELHIAPAAAEMLKTGDFHPGRLRYPALPKYVAALAMAVGFIQAAAKGEIRSVEEIGSVSFPYYNHPRIVGAARLAFALLSVLALAATGWLAWLLVGRPGALLMAPLVLLVSDNYFMMSWRYLNVDIVGTAFVAAGIAATVHATKAPHSLLRVAVVPAACVGLAAASKYTHALLLVPVVLAVLLFAPAQRRLSAIAAAVLTAGFVFVVANPFSVLDLPSFLNDLAYEAHHYASGHPGHDPDKGWTKLAFYSRTVAADFGIVALIAGALGLGVAIRSDWRRAAIVASLPLALLGLLSAQRVEFARNMLPVFPLLAVFVAVGIHFAYDHLRVLAKHFPGRGMLLPNMPRHLHKLLDGAVFTLLSSLILLVPFTNFGNQLFPVENSRKQAVSWISSNLSEDTILIVPRELGLDARRLLAQGFPVQVTDFVPLDTGAKIDAIVVEVSPVAVLIPRWYADPRFPNTELAPRLNEAAAQAALEPIASFGGSGIKVNIQPILINHLAPRVTIAVPANN